MKLLRTVLLGALALAQNAAEDNDASLDDEVRSGGGKEMAILIGE